MTELRAMKVMEAYFKRFHRKKVQGTRLQIIHVIFWQRHLLISTFIIRSFSRLKFKSSELLSLLYDIDPPEDFKTH